MAEKYSRCARCGRDDGRVSLFEHSDGVKRPTCGNCITLLLEMRRPERIKLKQERSGIEDLRPSRRPREQ